MKRDRDLLLAVLGCAAIMVVLAWLAASAAVMSPPEEPGCLRGHQAVGASIYVDLGTGRGSSAGFSMVPVCDQMAEVTDSPPPYAGP